MRIESEVVIVGAGVAGLALAGQIGRAGHGVLLIDKAAAPRDKVCGEGIMPLGLGVLERLGLGRGALPGAPFDGLDFHTSRRQAPLRFAAGRQGRGIRRTALIQALEETVRAQPTVRFISEQVLGPIWSGARNESVVGVRSVEHEYTGSVVIAADGVNSSLARQLPHPPQRFGYRMALRRHYRLRRPLPRVQVGLLPGMDLYLTPVGDDCVLATTLTDQVGYRRWASGYEAMLTATPFAPWFDRAEPVSKLLGWYHPLLTPRHYAPGEMLLVGDASGGIDPCMGMGISMALVSTEYAAEAVLRLLRQPQERAAALRRYHELRSSLFRHYHAFGRIFRLLVGTQAGAALLVRGMEKMPGLADRLLAIVAEARPWQTLGSVSRAGARVETGRDRMHPTEGGGVSAPPMGKTGAAS